MFELTDQSGRPAGHIEVTLKWTFRYAPTSDSGEFGPEDTTEQKPEEEKNHLEDVLQEEEGAEDLQRSSSSSHRPEDAPAQVRTQTC